MSAGRYRASYLDEFYEPFAVSEVDFRDPEPTELLVRTTAVPFCSTDWMGWRAMRPMQPPVIMGHTGVGVVEAVGSAVTDLRPGDRVLVAGTPECGECFFCRLGRPDQCSWLTEMPVPVVAQTPDGRELRAAGRVGGYAEAMLVNRNQTHRLETDLPDRVTALLGCGISSALGAVFTIGEVQPGQTVAILGLGHLGLWAVQGARIAGAARIIAIDVVPGRRALAASMGATDTVDAIREDAVEVVRSLTEGRGADVVIEAAGPEVAARQAVEMARRAGTVVLMGVSHSRAEVSIPQSALTIHGKRVCGCQNGQITPHRDFARWIGMLESGELDPKGFVTREYSLDEADAARDASLELRDVNGLFTSFR